MSEAEAEKTGAPGSKRGPGRIGMPTALVVTGCLFLMAVALQSLRENAAETLRSMGEGNPVLPVVALGGLALVVVVVLAVVLLRHLGKLLVSVRMIGAVLLALAVLVAAGQLFAPEAGPGRTESSAAARVAERCGDLFGEGAGERVAGVAMLARLGDPAGSWGVRALIGFLALASLAGIGWRRPVGVREFGHLAAHLGVLLILLALAARALFGYHQSDLRIARDQTPVPVPAGGRPAFTLRLLRVEEERRPTEYQVWAAPVGAESERLDLDGSRRSSTRWREWSVEVLEFRARCAAEERVEEGSSSTSRPAIPLRLSGEGPEEEALLETGQGRVVGGPRRLRLGYERFASAAEADAAATRDRPGPEDRLAVIAPDGSERDFAPLPAGARKVGRPVLFRNLGAALRVTRWLSAAQLDAAGQLQEAPPGGGAPPGIELAGAGGPEAPTFRVLGDGRAAEPAGTPPAELRGFRLKYETFPDRPYLALIEGPAGAFRAVEFRWGQPGEARALAVGGELEPAAGTRLRLVGAPRQVVHVWRPRQQPGSNEDFRPACRIAVARAGGAGRRELWLFEGRGPAEEALGAAFQLRTGGRELQQQTAVLELADKRGTLGEYPVSYNRPLRVRGYQIVLAGADTQASAGGPVSVAPALIISRDYGIWALYAGMFLAVLGAVWLLWTRLRNVADADGWEA